MRWCGSIVNRTLQEVFMVLGEVWGVPDISHIASDFLMGFYSLKKLVWQKKKKLKV